MPSFTRGKFRDTITFVLLFSSPSNIYYNWSAKDLGSITGVEQADLTALGHLTTVADGSLVIVAATSPKPPTVRKLLLRNPTASQQGSVATFCGNANLNSALSRGWKLSSRSRGTLIRNDARSVTALAKISNEMIYASPMNAADHTDHSASLGLIDPTTITTQTERNVIVRGSSRPRAGRAKLNDSNGSTLQAFYSYDAELSGGWQPSEPEIL